MVFTVNFVGQFIICKATKISLFVASCVFTISAREKLHNSRKVHQTKTVLYLYFAVRVNSCILHLFFSCSVTSPLPTFTGGKSELMFTSLSSLPCLPSKENWFEVDSLSFLGWD